MKTIKPGNRFKASLSNIARHFNLRVILPRASPALLYFTPRVRCLIFDLSMLIIVLRKGDNDTRCSFEEPCHHDRSFLVLPPILLKAKKKVARAKADNDCLLGLLSYQCSTFNCPHLLICRCEVKEPSLKLLHEAGPPMYLGFLIHVFLHFVIMQTRISGSGLYANEELTAPLLLSN